MTYGIEGYNFTIYLIIVITTSCSRSPGGYTKSNWPGLSVQLCNQYVTNDPTCFPSPTAILSHCSALVLGFQLHLPLISFLMLCLIHHPFSHRYILQ